MKAIRISRTGGAEVLEPVELPTPRPRAGELLVRVEAAGVNFIDVYHRSGAYPRDLPFVLGEEGAGVVEAVGPGVEGMRAGQRVAWSNASGSYATHVIARPESVVTIPDGVSAQQAAAVMLQGMTAHYLARATFPLKPGDSCLVHAAAGGVGLLLVQMAKSADARVFATTSTEEKAKLVRGAGADEVLLYDQGAFDQIAKARTGGRGVDVVYDSVGLSTFERSLRSLRARGLLVLFGQSSGRVPPLDLQVLSALGSLFVTRPTLRDYLAGPGELAKRAGAVLDGVQTGSLKVRVHATFPLERAAEAHRALESRTTSGKLLLVPSASVPDPPRAAQS